MGAFRVVATCLHRSRNVFRLLVFIMVATLGTAVVFYLKVEDRGDYLGRLHGPHHFGRNLGMMEEFQPGQHLKGRPFSSKSYCNFTFKPVDSADPWDMLAFDPGQVQPSVQLGEDGPYRVVYNVVSSLNASRGAITYCTHATPDFIFHLSELLLHWDGAVSVTLYAPGSDAHLAALLVDKLCRCVPQMAQVSVHLSYPKDMPPVKGDWVTVDDLKMDDCSPPAKKIDTQRKTQDLTYPVNVGRNAARQASKTNFVLVSDIELIPSRGLNDQFAVLLRRLTERRNILMKTRAVSNWTGKGFVYVLPVFEIEPSASVPQDKEQLLKLYSKDRAVFFHRWVCPHCQKFPGLQKWLKRKGKADFIQPLIVVNREYPFHRWEPVYIGTKNEPLYSEELTWEGQQDKMTQMDQMCLEGYKFVILDRAFLVHSPGIKRKSPIVSKWRKPHEQKNMKLYISITQNLLKKYENPNQRCKLQ
ncbi:beta-1,4-glucuronyltransferase 1-like [Neocloeon triangulifer]|uniref:beta-1,4-glucuronyltransferase 1-like n=1 Tax=Neocloeon triangulifer TaxID=2078957 RepID=UPI00286EBB9E|nr:beta-1,4-glucuronyltransferase 1-like [Neocloeon triangulifer]